MNKKLPWADFLGCKSSKTRGFRRFSCEADDPTSPRFFFDGFYSDFFQRGPKSAPHTALVGCPGTEVRIKGDRTGRLFHPNVSLLWVGEITY